MKSKNSVLEVEESVYAEMLLFVSVLDWKGSSAGRDQWLCWTLYHTEGMWLDKGNMADTADFAFSLSSFKHVLAVYYVLKLKAFFSLVKLDFAIGLSEQGQAREAAGSGRDVLPEAGSLSNALCLGNR